MWRYNPDDDVWAVGPALPFHVHHVFGGAFSFEDRIILLTGLVNDGGLKSRHRSQSVMLTLNTSDANPRWQTVSVPQLGGFLQCSLQPYEVKGVDTYYCLVGTNGEYVKGRGTLGVDLLGVVGWLQCGGATHCFCSHRTLLALECMSRS